MTFVPSIFPDQVFLRCLDDGKLCVHDQGGFIMPHAAVENLIANIRRWYADTDEDAIAAHNHELYERYFLPTPYPASKKPNQAKPKQAKVYPGFVYLIKSGPHYKIGRTKDLKSRISGIGAKLAIAPVVLATFPVDDAPAAESRLHELFAHKRLNGEWFDLDDHDVATIRSLFED